MPDSDDLLKGLDPEQLTVAQALRGPVLVVAGAGTGKTRAITHRIAYGVASGVYKPSEVLAVTFTTKAAGEMRGRLGALGAPGVQARTFHSAALRQARYFWPDVYGTEFPEIIKSKFALVIEAQREVGLNHRDNAQTRDLAAEIEWAKVSNVGPNAYAAAARAAHRQVGDLDPSAIGPVLAAYEESKRRAGRIDMEDILLITAAILADEPRIAARVRSQYRWFVVDEFQDVNPLQSMLLDLWLGGRDDVCVVGDPRQTIYSFAGASPRILGDFARKFPDAERLELVRNYRSTPQVVDVANAVFPRGTRTSAQDAARLVAQAPSGEPVRYVGHPDEPAEATATAQAIQALHASGVPYREMAVLFRINAQSEVYQEALGALGVPYVLRGVEGFFQRAEVRQAITLLRGAARAGQGEPTPLVDEVRSVLAAMGHTDAPPAGGGEVRNRWESLDALVTMASDLGPAASLTQLVADLDQRAEHAHAPAADGVTLATLHSAKGLEWEAVFCVGTQEGTLPYSMADTPEAIEEERRLFYVGVTRAKRVLTVSWSRARKPGGKGNRRPSRFLDTLLPADHQARQNVATKKVGKKSPAAVDALDELDRAMFEQLKSWRLERAREESVPAFVVFNDATLAALAQHRPSSLQALGAMPGIGAAKIEKYGEAVLEVLSR